MQNVALMWCWASRSRTWVVSPPGPSSKVSATAVVPVFLIEPNGPWLGPPLGSPDEDGAVGGGPLDLVGAAGPAGLVTGLEPDRDGGSEVAGAGSGGVSPLSWVIAADRWAG